MEKDMTMQNMRLSREEPFTAERCSQLYEEYAGSVYRFIYFRIGDISEAEDLTAEVFRTIIEKSSRYQKEKGNIRTWIFAIARNKTIDHLRKRKPKLSYEQLSGQESGMKSPHEELMGKEERTIMQRAMGNMGEREATILSAKYAIGMKNIEIAKMLHISEKNVGVILVRAKGKLKSILKKEGIGIE